jgi:hypothetical protein
MYTQENMSFALGSMQDKSAKNDDRRLKIQDIMVSDNTDSDVWQNSHASQLKGVQKLVQSRMTDASGKNSRANTTKTKLSQTVRANA